MLKKLRTKVIKLCTKGSLAVALAFGFNAVAFVVLQNKLELSIARDEAQIALKEALNAEKNSANLIEKNYRDCGQEQHDGCAELAKNIVIRKNRLRDLTVFFKSYPFSVSSDHGLIRNIKSTTTAIDIIAEDGFGISFKEARAKGINSADDYSKYVGDQKGIDLSKKIAQANIDNQIKQIVDNVSFMIGWNSENIYDAKVVEANSTNAWRSLIALIVFELIIYILVSTSDFWLTNLPNRKEPTRGLSLINTKSAIPMIAYIIFGFCAVVISQRIVYIELEKTVLEGCRRINRNSIFMFNQSQDPKGDETQETSDAVIFPNYCVKSVRGKNNKSETTQENIREKILQNSERIANKQKEKSDESSDLALSLLIFNTLAMASEAIKLDFQSMESDED